jgi:hypothetical protein
LARILNILEMSALAILLLLVLVPVAYHAASKNSYCWVAAYPILLLLNCGGTVALCLSELTHPPPQPAFVAPHGELKHTLPQPSFVAPPNH